MKNIISESQLLEYSKVDDAERFINDILDKVSKDGQAALSDDEKKMLFKFSRGEKITPEIPANDNSYSVFDDEPSENPSDLTLMFMDVFPEFDNIMVNNENWHVEQEDSSESLIVQNDNGIEFNIYPFSKEVDKLMIMNDDFSFSFNMTKKLESYNDMRRFVDSFKVQIFPQIIQKVKEQYI